jgi:hypothetical protein
MLCSACHKETDGASLFCHLCDVYLASSIAGKKANVGARLLAHLLDILVGFAIFMTITLVSCGIGAVGIQTGNSVNSQDVAGIGSLMGVSTFFCAVAGYIVVLLFFLARQDTGKSNLWDSGCRHAKRQPAGHWTYVGT